MARKQWKRVDVTGYERTKRGRRESVRRHTRSQMVSDGEPGMNPLQRPAFQAPRPFVRRLKGTEKALDEIAREWDDMVKRNLGPDFSGVLRDYDWENPESAPIVTGDLRDTTNFVVVDREGNALGAVPMLFEQEVESDQEDEEYEAEDDPEVREMIREREKRPQAERDYDAYMRVWESWSDAGIFDDLLEKARKANRDAGIGATAYRFADSYEHGGRESGHNEFTIMEGTTTGSTEDEADRVVRKLREMGYSAETFAPFGAVLKRGIRITGGGRR